jgi:hypothetical protein
MRPKKLLTASFLALLSSMTIHAQDTLAPGTTSYADILDDWKDQDQIGVRTYRAAISSIVAGLPFADSALVLSRLNSYSGLADNSAELMRLYARACSARRAMRMINYVAKFQKLLFSEHPIPGLGYFFANYYDAGGAAGKGLGMITMNGSYGSVTQLLPSGEARHPDVSFDATRAVFAWRGGTSGSSVYHLYEMNLSTRTTRQLTSGNNGEFSIDLDPCYLPNGNIVFVSTRYAQEIDCVKGRVTNLFLCDKDGKYMRQIGFDQAPVSYPCVLPNG